MKKYINQLLQDIKQAILLRETAFQLENESEGDEMDCIREVEQYLNGIPFQNMYDHFGLGREVFPSEEKLSDGQIEFLVDALLDLWAIHRFFCSFPEEAPKRMIYPLLLKTMEAPIFLHKYGNTHIDMCEFNPPECPVKKYCTCKEFLNEFD